MTRRVVRVALTAHVVSSVGWIGAVLVFLGLALIGLRSSDLATVRGVYLVMEPAARFVLLPLGFASLITGVVQSLLTPWGLFRHYWVVAKLAITLFSVIVLLSYMKTFRAMAAVASDTTLSFSAIRNPSPLIHAFLALVVLLIATVLAIFKPRGMTPYGWRRNRMEKR